MGFQNLSNCLDLSKYAKSAGKRETWPGYYLTNNILPMLPVPNSFHTDHGI